MATTNPAMDQGAEVSPAPQPQSGKKKGKSKNKPGSAEDGGAGQSGATAGGAGQSGATAGQSEAGKKGGNPTQAGKDKPADQPKKEKSSKPPQAPQAKGGKPGDAGGDGQSEAPKSKAQLKAERRAIQEKQRALKDAKKVEAGAGKTPAAGPKKDTSAPTVKPDNKGGNSSKGGDKPSVRTKKKMDKEDRKGVMDEKGWENKEREMLTRGCKIDDTIFNLGFQYLHHKIVGANARCVALLTALKQVISKYKTPDEKMLSRDLGKNFLTPFIKYINDCRPLSTSMGNAIKHLKQHISQIPEGTDDDKAIFSLHDVIDNFIYDNIIKAAEAVAVYANNKIDDGDVILIYAASSLIAQVLKYAHNKGKQFRVIVVEGRPRSEGKNMLRYLVRCGIPCSYIYIGSASHAMRETTKVFLGAAAMFAIGDMHSRAGNAMIATLARANNIPVLVCCESYKFTDKVQLSSGNFHQQGRGKDLVSIGHRDSIIDQHSDLDLKLMNVMYDVTHSKYITALVTELGMLPCTSVPVVLRRQEDKCL